jgi:hypothetical protein
MKIERKLRQASQTTIFSWGNVDDLGINHGPGLYARKFQENDALRYAELGSGDAASVASDGAPVGEGVGEIADEVADFGSRGVFHWSGLLPQERVAELEDGPDGHGVPGCQLPT